MPVDERHAAADLLLEVAHGSGEGRPDEVFEALLVQVARAEVDGEQDRTEVIEDASNHIA